jgi:hypothetical protein
MMKREEIIAALLKRGAKRDAASQYADAYLEYHQAADRVTAAGLVVAHPVHGGPIENPYLSIRDKALARLQAMRKAAFIDVDWLW